MWVSCGTRMHRSQETSPPKEVTKSTLKTQEPTPKTTCHFSLKKKNNLSSIGVKAKVFLPFPFNIFHFSSDNANISLLDSLLGCCIYNSFTCKIWLEVLNDTSSTVLVEWLLEK